MRAPWKSIAAWDWPTIRAAGLRPDCPMDVYVISALTEPPLLHLHYPSVEQAQARDRGATNDGTLPLEPYQLISQYTLEPLLKSIAETIPAVDVRFGCEFLSLRQDAAGVTASVRTPVASARRSARPIWSAATAARVPSASNSASAFAARATCWRCARRCSAATSCSSGSPSARARPRPPLSRRGRQVTFLIMQDSTRHWTLHSLVDSDEEMKRAVRADRRHSGRIRDAVLRAVAAESAARRPLSRGPCLSRRRCRRIWLFRPAGSA